jgi:hypothetical protein
MRVIQRILMCEQSMVHLPEVALRSCRFGGFSGGLRVFVTFGQWEIAEHKSKAIAQYAAKLLNNWKCSSTMRALEVAIFNQGDRRGCTSLDMIPIRYGHGECS